MPYPASSYPEGVDLTIIAGNQLHQVINGEANEVVSTTSGDIPSVRKALADSMMFKVPVDWVQGEVTTDPLETRLYNGQPYWAPEATLANPITLGASPVATTDWLLAPQGYRNEYNLGKYQAGILISDSQEYVVYNGESYFAVSPPYITTATTPDNDGNMFEGGYTTIKSSAEVFSNTNLLSNHNFLAPSPEDITHPNATPKSYVAGTQIFSGVYAGDSGCTITFIDGRVNCKEGDYQFSASNTGGLERVPAFTSSVSDYDGIPKTTGVSHALVSGEYVVTVTPSAGDVFSVKFEQGGVATRHEAGEAFNQRQQWRDDVDVRGWGAVGDGITDDTAALQSAIDIGVAKLQGGKTYKIDGTLNFPSNSGLTATSQAILIGTLTAEGSGWYPNTIVKSEDSENVSFKNIVLDSNRRGKGYDYGAGLTSVNALFMENAKNVTFENFHFFDFVTNGDPANSSDPDKALNFGVAQFRSCERVYFNNLKIENVMEEGPAFYKCKDVSIKNVTGVTNNTSSYFGFWYCIGVAVVGGNFKHNGGSLINCFSSDVVFDHLQCNSQEIPNGRGIGLENEFDFQDFDVYNISITNCTLFVKRYGVNGILPSNSNRAEVLNVENNYFNVIDDDGTFGGVILSPVNGCSVKNNRIFLTDSGQAKGDGVLILMQPDSSIPGIDFQSVVQVESNTIRAYTGVSIRTIDFSRLSLLDINSNVFYALPRNGGAINQGGSSFVHIRNPSSATEKTVIEKVSIKYNICYDMEGNCINTNLQSPTNFHIKNVIISKNVINMKDVSAHPIYWMCGETVDHSEVRVSNNTIHEGLRVHIKDSDYLRMEGNTRYWNSESSDRRLVMEDCFGELRYLSNTCNNVSSVNLDVYGVGATSLAIAQQRDNVSVRGDGTFHFSSSIIDTALPN